MPIDMISVSPLNLENKKKENLHGELEHFKHRQTILIQIKLVHIIVSGVVKKQGLTWKKEFSGDMEILRCAQSWGLGVWQFHG